jgi:hypothetical protein
MYYGLTTPLITQLVLIPLKIFQNQIFEIHVLKKDIERPFKVEKSGFEKFFESMPQNVVIYSFFQFF